MIPRNLSYKCEWYATKHNGIQKTQLLLIVRIMSVPVRMEDGGTNEVFTKLLDG